MEPKDNEAKVAVILQDSEIAQKARLLAFKKAAEKNKKANPVSVAMIAATLLSKSPLVSQIGSSSLDFDIYDKIDNEMLQVARLAASLLDYTTFELLYPEERIALREGQMKSIREEFLGAKRSITRSEFLREIIGGSGSVNDKAEEYEAASEWNQQDGFKRDFRKDPKSDEELDILAHAYRLPELPEPNKRKVYFEAEFAKAKVTVKRYREAHPKKKQARDKKTGEFDKQPKDAKTAKFAKKDEN